MTPGRYRKAMILYYADLEKRMYKVPQVKRKILEPKMKIGKRRREQIRKAVRKVVGKR